MAMDRIARKKKAGQKASIDGKAFYKPKKKSKADELESIATELELLTQETRRIAKKTKADRFEPIAREFESLAQATRKLTKSPKPKRVEALQKINDAIVGMVERLAAVDWRYNHDALRLEGMAKRIENLNPDDPNFMGVELSADEFESMLAQYQSNGANVDHIRTAGFHANIRRAPRADAIFQLCKGPSDVRMFSVCRQGIARRPEAVPAVPVRWIEAAGQEARVRLGR
jgi:hypothetical protein